MAKYIDADLLRKEIEKERKSIDGLFTEGDNSFYDGQDDAYNHTLALIESLQQEQPEVDLEKELYKHFGQVKDFTLGMQIGKYFYELGRKQVLQEIYDGKTKPVDKITAAWLDDKEEDK